MIKRYDLLVYRNEQGSGAKVINCDDGPYVKWEDVKKMLDEAWFAKGYDPAEKVRGWNFYAGKGKEGLFFCTGAEND